MPWPTLPPPLPLRSVARVGADGRGSASPPGLSAAGRREYLCALFNARLLRPALAACDQLARTGAADAIERVGPGRGSLLPLLLLLCALLLLLLLLPPPPPPPPRWRRLLGLEMSAPVSAVGVFAAAASAAAFAVAVGSRPLPLSPLLWLWLRQCLRLLLRGSRLVGAADSADGDTFWEVTDFGESEEG